MIRRWLIRSFALFLVAACSTAWGWSFHNGFSITYGTTTAITGVDSWDRHLFISRYSNGGANNQVVGWLLGLHIDSVNSGDPNPEAFDGEFDPETLIWRFGGFAFWRKADNSDEHFFAIAIPYWFIESTTVLIALYAWKKTRRKPSAATAFPVEIKS